MNGQPLGKNIIMQLQGRMNIIMSIDNGNNYVHGKE